MRSTEDIYSEAMPAKNDVGDSQDESIDLVSQSNESRRNFLKTLGLTTVGVFTACSHTSQAENSGAIRHSSVPSHLNLDDFILHSKSPLTLEAKRDVVGTSVITSEEHLFIRNNLPSPPPS